MWWWSRLSFPLEGYIDARCEDAAGSSEEVESCPTQLFETADVSPVEGTIAVGNYSFFFGSPRNGIEEADGSIPFSSTKFLGFIFLKGGLKRIRARIVSR
jgi:hypothetical protein